MSRQQQRQESLTLGILEAIDNQSDVTQRRLATNLGVALGLANSYLKRCVRKGLVKIQQAPPNRYLYYLTPMGFAEKSRLTGEYLAASFDYYNRAGVSVSNALQLIEQAGAKKLLLAGVSELAEIASVRAHDFDISIIGTFDRTTSKTKFIGLPIWRRLELAVKFEAVLYTDMSGSSECYAELTQALSTDSIYVPDILESTLAPHLG
ncbi:MAG: putative transcriptional regulator [Gammaproteobacteria bacterium]|jgi:predicted transcriptional regulator